MAALTSRDALARIRRFTGELRLTSRGWGVLVSAVVCLLFANWFSVEELNYVGSLLAGLTVLSIAYVFVGHSRVGVQRTFAPDVIGSGEDAEVTIEVRNRSLLPSLEARWRDQVPSSVVGRAQGGLPALGSGRSSNARVTFTYAVRGGRRGEHRIGPLSISLPDPFGLAERQHTYGESTVLTVLPKIIELPLVRLVAHGVDGQSQLVHRHAGIGADDIIAREYVAGDPVRHLHWKATARRAQLMVRQEEQLSNPKATLVFNADASSFGGHRTSSSRTEAGHLPSFEWAVVQAASIARSLVGAGYGLSFETVGDHDGRRLEISDDHYGDAIEDVMVDLARIGPCHDADCRPANLSLQFEPPRPLIAVLGRVDASAAREWRRVGHAATSSTAFLAQSTPDDARMILETAGWTCVSATNGDDLVERWHSLDATSGARYARH